MAPEHAGVGAAAMTLRTRANGRIQHSREELLLLGKSEACRQCPPGLDTSVFKELSRDAQDVWLGNARAPASEPRQAEVIPAWRRKDLPRENGDADLLYAGYEPRSWDREAGKDRTPLLGRPLVQGPLNGARDVDGAGGLTRAAQFGGRSLSSRDSGDTMLFSPPKSMLSSSPASLRPRWGQDERPTMRPISGTGEYSPPRGRGRGMPLRAERHSLDAGPRRPRGDDGPPAFAGRGGRPTVPGARVPRDSGEREWDRDKDRFGPSSWDQSREYDRDWDRGALHEKPAWKPEWDRGDAGLDGAAEQSSQNRKEAFEAELARYREQAQRERDSASLSKAAAAKPDDKDVNQAQPSAPVEIQQADTPQKQKQEDGAGASAPQRAASPWNVDKLFDPSASLSALLGIGSAGGSAPSQNAAQSAEDEESSRSGLSKFARWFKQESPAEQSSSAASPEKGKSRASPTLEVAIPEPTQTGQSRLFALFQNMGATSATPPVSTTPPLPVAGGKVLSLDELERSLSSQADNSRSNKAGATQQHSESLKSPSGGLAELFRKAADTPPPSSQAEQTAPPASVPGVPATFRTLDDIERDHYKDRTPAGAGPPQAAGAAAQHLLSLLASAGARQQSPAPQLNLPPELTGAAPLSAGLADERVAAGKAAKARVSSAGGKEGRSQATATAQPRKGYPQGGEPALSGLGLDAADANLMSSVAGNGAPQEPPRVPSRQNERPPSRVTTYMEQLPETLTPDIWPGNGRMSGQFEAQRASGPPRVSPASFSVDGFFMRGNEPVEFPQQFVQQERHRRRASFDEQNLFHAAGLQGYQQGPPAYEDKFQRNKFPQDAAAVMNNQYSHIPYPNPNPAYAPSAQPPPFFQNPNVPPMRSANMGFFNGPAPPQYMPPQAQYMPPPPPPGHGGFPGQRSQHQGFTPPPPPFAQQQQELGFNPSMRQFGGHNAPARPEWFADGTGLGGHAGLPMQMTEEIERMLHAVRLQHG